MNERPTPETDALILSKDGFGATDYEWRQHSRKLERERDEAREQLKEARKHLKDANRGGQRNAIVSNIQAGKLVELRKERDKLENDLDSMKRERDEAREALESHTTATIHTCHSECKRPMCVLRRERAQAQVNSAKALRERDEAREELSSIHRWVERHNQDGFNDKLTHRQNVDICYDLLYDRLDMAELELNRIKRAVIATLDENRHLADGMDCTLIKLRAVVPTWK